MYELPRLFIKSKQHTNVVNVLLKAFAYNAYRPI